MPYAVYQINPTTYQLAPVGLYRDYRLLRESFRRDVEAYVQSLHPNAAVRTVATLAEVHLASAPSGFYLVQSHDHPDRLDLHQKGVTSVPGRLWGATEQPQVVTRAVFTVVAIDALEEGSQVQTFREATSKGVSTTLRQHHGHAMYMDELKANLERRRKVIAARHRNDDSDFSEEE